MIKETWADVKGYENYYRVSSFGRVKSLERVVVHGDGTRTIKETMLVNILDNGYNHVSLSVQGRATKIRVHRIVATAFIPNCNNKDTVNHIDGNKTNNNVNNLEWATIGENIRHAHKTGLTNSHGENNTSSVLKYDEVVKIRDLHKTGKYLHRELAEMFGVSRRNIGYIVNKSSWATMDKDKSKINETI